MVEEWKPIGGYEGLYEVSNLGNVRTTAGLKRKLTAGSGGYLRVGLTKDGYQKLHSVHRLVAIAFLPNPHHLKNVNHKDEDRKNNRVDNLEWCTSAYNNTYGNSRQKWHDTVYNNSISMEYNGEVKRVGEWADILGCHVSTVYDHYKKGKEHFSIWISSRLKNK